MKPGKLGGACARLPGRMKLSFWIPAAQIQTVEICKQYTPHVYSVDWPGYGEQKNRALEKVHNDWVLSLDADEWVSTPLRLEIENAIQKNVYTSYWMPRRTLYCGRFLRFGDIGKDKVRRLFHRQFGKFTPAQVHESISITGKSGFLHKPLLHNCCYNIVEWQSKVFNYAKLSAKVRVAKGQRSNPWNAGFHAGWSFIRNYLLRLGFLDGRLGWVSATLNAKGSFLRHQEIWRHQEEN
jgi:glycosyltransferase involved in cell wall biosynthesis